MTDILERFDPCKTDACARRCDKFGVCCEEICIDEIERNRAAIGELVNQLKIAEIFINQNSEPWYNSGQRLLAEVRAAIAKHDTPTTTKETT